MTLSHPLDRPVWSALTGGRQAALALGDARALRLAPEYGLFAAAADETPASLAALAALNTTAAGLGLVEARDVALPPGVRVVKQAACVQMTAAALTAAAGPAFVVTPLADGDAAEMLALATLTEPGPFFEKTHRLGDFIGVRQVGRLVAMAGERLKPDGFTEVSGVCTHPDWRGRGYAGGLMRAVAARILERGETPFLHSYAANAGAIALYRSLGFTVRSAVTFTVLAGSTGDEHERSYGHG